MVHSMNSIVVFFIHTSKLVMISILEQSFHELSSLFQLSHIQMKGYSHFILTQLLHLPQSHHKEDYAPAQQ